MSYLYRGPVNFRKLNLSRFFPITNAKFDGALRRKWYEYRTAEPNKRHRVGLAVSGGVDSMALAVLCANLQKSGVDFVAIAFIVDHRAREGSTEEAERTCQRLEKIGIIATILPLQWPTGVSPLSLPNFETQARTLRYRALGTACKQKGLRWLMTGHHRDDQAETALMQLASERSSPGHLGIKARTCIPECWGMHGVHQSGTFESAENVMRQLERPIDKRWHPPDWAIHQARRLTQSRKIMEKGGVNVLRPLLGFSKGDLIETCKANDITWEEDQTNSEVWRTPRNAVRALLTRAKLPAALQKQNLLDMVDRSPDQERLFNGRFHAIEHACDIVSFDLRSGVLKVRMVERLTFEVAQADSPTVLSKQRIAASVLESFLSSVSPLETVRLQALKKPVETIFADFNARPPNDSAYLVSLTAGGVLLRRQYLPIAEPATPSEKRYNPPLDSKFIWSLSRQPPDGGQSDITILPSPLRGTGRHHKRRLWGAWQLWDGRYWIRVKNKGPQRLIIRHLRSTDMKTIEAALSKQSWAAFSDLLHEAAPGKIRWTLPVIIQPAHKEGEKDMILVLPSIGKKGQINVIAPDGKQRLDWDIRYKQVSLRPRDLGHSKRFSNIKHHNELLISWDDTATTISQAQQTSDTELVSGSNHTTQSLKEQSPGILTSP